MTRSHNNPRRPTALHWQCTALAIVWLAVLGGPLTAQPSKVTKAERALANLQSLHREAHQLFADDLERVAQTCEVNDLKETAARVRHLAQPIDPDVLRFEPLPREVQPAIPAPAAGEFSWQTELRTSRKAYAAELDKLASQAVKGGLPSYAYQLIREVAFHDSDHVRARRLLGFERYKDEWVSPFEATKLKNKEVWTKPWGWLPATHVARYEKGERYNGRRWVTSERDDELHSDFGKPWEIRTEHYLLKTNHSLELGVALASSLEEFHRFFEQTFAGFFNDPKSLQLRFENPMAAARAAKPFQIYFFRSREEYINRLLKKYGQQIAITNGLYDTDDLIVYSFHNPEEPAEPTLYHEATHQLLAAHLKPSPVIAREENFWLIEGIACYIESFRVENGEVSLGDPRCLRFVAARFRKLSDPPYYLPLAEFTALGKEAFQRHPQIKNNYSQASGLVHFFMHYEGGRYRDDLIDHLRDVYRQAETGRRPRALEILTGANFAELDQQYGEYVLKVSQTLKEDFSTLSDR